MNYDNDTCQSLLIVKQFDSDAEALRAFRSDPPHFLTVSAKRKAKSNG